jgi:hypothetical protein
MLECLKTSWSSQMDQKEALIEIICHDISTQHQEMIVPLNKDRWINGFKGLKNMNKEELLDIIWEKRCPILMDTGSPKENLFFSNRNELNLGCEKFNTWLNSKLEHCKYERKRFNLS